MSEYKFDTTSLAAIMRECLIQLMNRRTGFNQETGENPAKAEDFQAVQPEVVKLRQKVLKAYNNQTFAPDKTPFSTEQIAMTVYRLVVEADQSVTDVCKMSNRSLLKKVANETPIG